MLLKKKKEDEKREKNKGGKKFHDWEVLVEDGTPKSEACINLKNKEKSERKKNSVGGRSRAMTEKTGEWQGKTEGLKIKGRT